jgi:hypothetical protein
MVRKLRRDCNPLLGNTSCADIHKLHADSNLLIMCSIIQLRVYGFTQIFNYGRIIGGAGDRISLAAQRGDQHRRPPFRVAVSYHWTGTRSRFSPAREYIQIIIMTNLLGWGGEYPSSYATAGRKGDQKGHRGITYSVRQFLKTANVIPPTRGRTGGVVFRIGFRCSVCWPHGRRSVPNRL